MGRSFICVRFSTAFLKSGTWKSFNFTVYGKTELHIPNLHHYTEYRINLTVCRAIETKEDANTSCSIPFERSKSTREKGKSVGSSAVPVVHLRIFRGRR